MGKRNCGASSGLGPGLTGVVHPGVTSVGGKPVTSPLPKGKPAQKISVNMFILESTPAPGAADPGTRRCHQSLCLQHQAGVEGWRRSHPQGPHP